MVKEPRPGRVKTRLGRDIGMVSSAAWFRRQSAALLHRIRDPRWHLVLAVSPDREGQLSRVWPGDLPRIPQGHGNLGDRMGRIMRNLPPGPACIIGADIPGIQTRHIADAFKALGAHEAVFGPANDGGYWLVGMKRAAPSSPSFLQNVRWSTEHALQDSLNTLPGRRVTTVATLSDVDTVTDLLALRHTTSASQSS
ncbi:TIGR04282 family arsenosugar biosynthesis glycosyltransferase [Shimia sp.]|uniref:TIGR04282 family arsenosugar biosynthesis glycosyltransferase n=1 Tax=Shimia sp. TaxID=1954381 RepID=UPI003297DC69